MEQMLNVEKIRAFLAKQQPKSHPILGHPLAEMEDYVRRQYVDMLCVFAQYENKGMDTAGNFITRLIAGAGMSGTAADHIKNAMELTVEKFQEFLRLCEENRFQDIFLLDAMLVSCAGGPPQKKQVEFLAEVAEILKVDKDHLKWLSLMAFIILLQSKEAYDVFCQELTSQLTVEQYTELILSGYCYIKEFIGAALIDTNDTLWIYYKKRTLISLTNYDITNKKTVIFENIEASANAVLEKVFPNTETVVMKNCLFTNWQFDFPAAKDIRLERCEYTMARGCNAVIKSLIQMNFAKQLIVHIDSCYFHDICTLRQSKYCSLFGNSANDNHFESEFYISHSKFHNIVKGGSGNWYVVITRSTGVYLEDCHFINCRGSDHDEGLFYACYISGKESCEFKYCTTIEIET